MDLFSELIAAVQSDLTVGDESSLFDPTTIKRAINRAYRKIGGMFKWVETKDALKTSTLADAEYYDYPENWRTDSIWKLTVDGTDYGDPLTFKDYTFERENNYPAGLTNIWSNFQRRYFITPVPSTTGNNNISIWGYKAVDLLVDTTDITIFSYSMSEINEAIVLEAVAILKNKGEISQPVRRSYATGSEMFSQEARSIVVNAWVKVAQEQSRLESTTPAWDVPNFFGTGINNNNAVRNRIGNF